MKTIYTAPEVTHLQLRPRLQPRLYEPAMSSATARAEARRKAILARGADRLSKLTTSARGEDAPVYMQDSKATALYLYRFEPDTLRNAVDKAAQRKPTSSTSEFLGEETFMPTPPPMSRSVSESPASRPSAGRVGAQGDLDTNTWSADQQRLLAALLGAAGGGTGVQNAQAQEQQQQLLNAMMQAAGGPPPSSRQQGRARSVPPEGAGETDPFSALLAGQSGDMPMPPLPDFLKPPAPRRPKTMLQKVLPLLHLVAAWALLAYFVFWREPQAFESSTYGAVQVENGWTRWADLMQRRPEQGWGVQSVVRIVCRCGLLELIVSQPFFWAFTTVAVVLHSWRIFQGVVSDGFTTCTSLDSKPVSGSDTTPSNYLSGVDGAAPAISFSCSEPSEISTNWQRLPQRHCSIGSWYRIFHLACDLVCMILHSHVVSLVIELLSSYYHPTNDLLSSWFQKLSTQVAHQHR